MLFMIYFMFVYTLSGFVNFSLPVNTEKCRFEHILRQLNNTIDTLTRL